MLNVLGSVAQFEREVMLERQREGIAKAKGEGKYKGRKPTARAKADGNCHPYRPSRQARCCPASEPLARAGFFAQADRGRLADTGRRRCVGRSDRCAGEGSSSNVSAPRVGRFLRRVWEPLCAPRVSLRRTRVPQKCALHTSLSLPCWPSPQPPIHRTMGWLTAGWDRISAHRRSNLALLGD